MADERRSANLGWAWLRASGNRWVAEVRFEQPLGHQPPLVIEGYCLPLSGADGATSATGWRLSILVDPVVGATSASGLAHPTQVAWRRTADYAALLAVPASPAEPCPLPRRFLLLHQHGWGDQASYAVHSRAAAREPAATMTTVG